MVYRVYCGVQGVLWCTGCTVVYRVYCGVQAAKVKRYFKFTVFALLAMCVGF